MSLETLKSSKELAKNARHGTRIKYMGGCRCLPCRAANSRYQSERFKAIKNGKWNGLIKTEKVTGHIKQLRINGIGTKNISELAEICRSSLLKIISGERKHIRKLTADKILAISVESAIKDGHYIDAKPTWSKIRWMLNQGFTKGSLAKKLGYKSRNLQINKKRVRAKTAMNVEKLYNLLNLEADNSNEPTQK